MGQPSATGQVGFRVVATVSAIFAIGVIAVSGALLAQSIRYRDAYYYGYSGYTGGVGADYYGSGRGYYGGQSGNYGGSYGQVGYGGGVGNGYYGGVGAGIGYQDVGYDIYRYQKVITISAIALGAGIIQFLVSLLLCCVTENNAKGMAIGYAAGSIFIFIMLVACFGLAFQYRVIYPYYFYNYYQLYQFPTVYSQYNPEGQAFCAILGINLIYLIVSIIVAGVFAKKATSYDDRVEWHVRPTTGSSGGVGNTEYRA